MTGFVPAGREQPGDRRWSGHSLEAAAIAAAANHPVAVEGDVTELACHAGRSAMRTPAEDDPQVHVVRQADVEQVVGTATSSQPALGDRRSDRVPLDLYRQSAAASQHSREFGSIPAVAIGVEDTSRIVSLRGNGDANADQSARAFPDLLEDTIERPGCDLQARVADIVGPTLGDDGPVEVADDDADMPVTELHTSRIGRFAGQ